MVFKRAIIIANGLVESHVELKKTVNKNDYVICVDGGLQHAIKAQLCPNLLLGDMDSIDPEVLRKFDTNSCEIIRHPVHKNDTDLELALQWVLEKGFSSALLCGLSGGRQDHHLANMLLLAQNRWAFNIELWDGRQTGWILRAKKTCFLPDLKSSTVSLIPLCAVAEGVKTQGLQYPLNNESLPFGTTRGISNVVEAEDAQVYLNGGVLLILATSEDFEKNSNEA